jgi:tetratricopeptide (TPR) repeat protein
VGFADTSDAREALALFDSLGDPDGASRCLTFLSADETFRAHWEAADALADQALARSREANDDLLIGASLRAKSMAQPSFAQALPIAVEAADYLRRAGNISFVALVLSTTGFIAITDGAYDQADKLLEQALEAGTIAGDVHRVATVRGNQGLVALFENRMQSATEAFREQLTLCRDSRISNPTLVWEGLSGLAAVAAARGEPELAAKLVGAASAYVDTPLNAAEAPVYDRLTERFLEPARAALGHPAWDRGCQEGSTLTLDDAIATGIQDMPSRSALRPAAG